MDYAPGSSAKKELLKTYRQLYESPIVIPL